MMQAKPHVTLLAGPQTRLALALNDAVRTHCDAIAVAGVTAIPNRIATRAFRAASAENFSDDERLALLGSALSLHEGRPVFLSAINLLGAPTAAYRRQELYPNAEQMIASAGATLSSIVTRVVMTAEPLHHFLFSLSLPTLNQRVADSSWETLYELSWSDLISEFCEAFPLSQLLVITSDAAFVGAKTLLFELFGPAGNTFDPAHLQRPHLTPSGKAALENIRAAGEPDPDILEGLLAAHRATPDPVELEARTGIDKLTSTLLDQRFLEDLRDLETLPNVRLL